MNIRLRRVSHFHPEGETANSNNPNNPNSLLLTSRKCKYCYIIAVFLFMISVVVPSILIGSNLFDKSLLSQSISSKISHDNDSSNNTNDTSKMITAPIKVAYVISLIECTDNHKSGQTSIRGLIDASLVLRHSIHQNSIRNPQSNSKYDYEMYAIIHEQAQSCAHYLQATGFTTIIKPPPILQNDIQGDALRKNIHKEVCCGVDEFVKLYAYTDIPHPVVVHLDIDFIFHKHMDAVIDVMLGSTDENVKLLVEREDETQPWPDTGNTANENEKRGKIEAMMTRDYHSSFGEGRHSGFQAGFWVIRPSQKHFDALLNIIREGNYVEGFSRENGWGGLGYGGFIGARAMQGLIAYYYDVHVPGTWIELNNCRYNAVGAIVTKKGKCRSNRETCEDCRNTNLSDIYSIHYTACRKPWSCIATRSDAPNNPYHRKYSIPVDIVEYDHCMKVQTVWHGMRRDLENKLYDLTLDESIKQAQQGEYMKEYFLGHCTKDQSEGYLPIGGSIETLERIKEIYE